MKLGIQGVCGDYEQGSVSEKGQVPSKMHVFSGAQVEPGNGTRTWKANGSL